MQWTENRDSWRKKYKTFKVFIYLWLYTIFWSSIVNPFITKYRQKGPKVLKRPYDDQPSAPFSKSNALQSLAEQNRFSTGSRELRLGCCLEIEVFASLFHALLKFRIQCYQTGSFSLYNPWFLALSWKVWAFSSQIIWKHWSLDEKDEGDGIYRWLLIQPKVAARRF